MSLAAVPICFSCSRMAQDVSIACTECNNLCCRACFGLAEEEEGDSADDVGEELLRTKRAKFVRVCSRCRGADKETEEDLAELMPMKQKSATDERGEATSPEERVEPTQNRCPSHDKEYTLYCLTCAELVCESCFPLQRSHMRHQIDHVEAVYQERRAEIEQKRMHLEEKIKVLQENAVQYEANLDTIREVERSVYDEIDMVCTKAKQSLANVTDRRKVNLQLRLDIPGFAQKLNESLKDSIQQLSPAELLKQQLHDEKLCDKILRKSFAGNFKLESSEDIGCELVPPYQMSTFRLDHFVTTTAWPQHEIMVCETRWTVALRKTQDSLFVKLTPHTEEALKFPFKLIVLIPHAEPQKTLRTTFNVEGTSEELEVVPNHQLEAGGFIEQSELVIKIGLRPLNALVENGLMKHHIKQTKKRLRDSTIRKDKKHKDLGSYVQAAITSKQFCISYFKMNLYKQKGDPSVKYSTDVTDITDRQWCLRMYAIHRTDTNTHLKAYISLRKGAPTKCRFFIELMHHSDPKKNIRKTTEHTFQSLNESRGWSCFIERQQLLSDPEFYPNKMLSFRFGALPIAD